MNREELEKMIEDEVATVVGSSLQEPEIPKPSTPSTPVKRTADLNDEELDEIIFYGGAKPEGAK